MSEKMYDIVSVGDCVMDFFSYVDHMPKVGETLPAHNFITSPGGKGANSIVASSRLGSKNAFISKVGNDSFGNDFIRILREDNICTDFVSVSKDKPTSQASIIVDDTGSNFCVVNYGATLDLNPSDVIESEEAIRNSKILVTTRMIKEESALQALKSAKKYNLITLFNFAPATSPLNDKFDAYVDLLVVNEIEAEAFIGSSVKSVKDAEIACQMVLSRDGFSIGCVVTLGGQGVVFGDKKSRNIVHIPCNPVDVVDSTGAGDSFVGALAHYLILLGEDQIERAVNLAADYATLTVKSKGTQSSYPYLNNLDSKFKC